MAEIDPNSFANVNDYRLSSLNWTVNHIDWKRQVLVASAILGFQTLEEQIPTLTLDTWGLRIKNIKYAEQALKYQLAAHDDKFGSRMDITLPDEVTVKGQKFALTIDYETTDKGTAIQFLKPEQTMGKQHPYFFTQCQAIAARSLLPCQDTPLIKFPYHATVHSSLPVVMSALHEDTQDLNGETKVYKFNQPRPIPSYLLAMAVGDLKSASIGPRSNVWTEPAQLEAAKWEFEKDTERFIQIGEELCTKYPWGRYDCLVLPPSFPYGGMENPCLTFVTPTLLAGDRSLVDVVAHEISHSWFGNNITTKDWQNFWLNEGFTVFLERKIIQRLHGEPHRHLSALVGWKALEDSVELFGNDHNFTRLIPDLKGESPDDAFSSVPYEKGFNLLFHIEKVVGGPEVFEPYMKSYVEHFEKIGTTDTESWKAHLFEYFKGKHGDSMVKKLDQIDWETWFYGTGMPPVDPEFDTSLVDQCYALAEKWRNNSTKDNEFSPKDIETFGTEQLQVFLEKVCQQALLSHARVELMDKVYQFSKSKNAEIVFRFYQIALKAKYSPLYENIAKWVVTVGRMKFCRPTLRSLYKEDPDLARKTFTEHRSFYHPIASALIEKDLELTSKD